MSIRQWAEDTAASEARFRHERMGDIRAALDGCTNAELLAAADGQIPEAVRALRQFDVLSRGLGLAEHRTSALAAELLEERWSDIETWLDRQFPNIDEERAL